MLENKFTSLWTCQTLLHRSWLAHWTAAIARAALAACTGNMDPSNEVRWLRSPASQKAIAAAGVASMILAIRSTTSLFRSSAPARRTISILTGFTAYRRVAIAWWADRLNRTRMHLRWYIKHSYYASKIYTTNCTLIHTIRKTNLFFCTCFVNFTMSITCFLSWLQDIITRC